MNSLTILGYVIAMALAPVAPFVIARWVRSAWQIAKALHVLSRERRMGETLYDCAEAIAGDAHNWRGMTEEFEVVDSGFSSELRKVNVDSCDAESGVYTIAQPPPQNSDGPALWPLIISELGDSETDRLVALDMRARHEFGVAKYGVPLVASNGRDHLADAYQEALDGVVYLRAEIESHLARTLEDVNTKELACTHQIYVDALDMAKEIRELIRERDGR